MLGVMVTKYDLTLNVQIWSGSIPAFSPIEKLMASGCDETETIYYRPGLRVNAK